MGVLLKGTKFKESKPLIIIRVILVICLVGLLVMMFYKKDEIYLILTITVCGIHYLFDGILDYKRTTESKKEALLSIVVGIIGIATSLLFYLLP